MMKYITLFILATFSVSAFASDESGQSTGTVTIYGQKTLNNPLIQKTIPAILEDKYTLVSPTELKYTFAELETGSSRSDNGRQLTQMVTQRTPIRRSERHRSLPGTILVQDQPLPYIPILRRVPDTLHYTDVYTRASWVQRIADIMPGIQTLTLNNFHFAPDLPYQAMEDSVEKLGRLPNTITHLTVQVMELDQPISTSEYTNWFERAIQILCYISPENLEELNIIYSAPGFANGDSFSTVERRSHNTSTKQQQAIFPESLRQINISTDYYNISYFDLVVSKLRKSQVMDININGIPHPIYSKPDFDTMLLHEAREANAVSLDSDSTNFPTVVSTGEPSPTTPADTAEAHPAPPSGRVNRRVVPEGTPTPQTRTGACCTIL